MKEAASLRRPLLLAANFPNDPREAFNKSGKPAVDHRGNGLDFRRICDKDLAMPAPDEIVFGMWHLWFSAYERPGICPN
jgi:hypothetical protein